MQENILDKYPDTSLRVYTVWLPMLATDAREEWDPGVLADERVAHFWDEERVVGTSLADQGVGDLGYSGIVWDAFLVFGPEAAWGSEPGPLVAAGAPVVDATADLEKALVPLLR